MTADASSQMERLGLEQRVMILVQDQSLICSLESGMRKN